MARGSTSSETPERSPCKDSCLLTCHPRVERAIPYAGHERARGPRTGRTYGVLFEDLSSGRVRREPPEDRLVRFLVRHRPGPWRRDRQFSLGLVTGLLIAALVAGSVIARPAIWTYQPLAMGSGFGTRTFTPNGQPVPTPSARHGSSWVLSRRRHLAHPSHIAFSSSRCPPRP